MSNKEDHDVRLKAVYYIYQIGEIFAERAGNQDKIGAALGRNGLRHEDFTNLHHFMRAAGKARLSDVKLEALFNDVTKDFQEAAQKSFADDPEGSAQLQANFGTLEGFAGTVQALESSAKNIIGMNYHKPMRESIGSFMTAVANGDHEARREQWPRMIQALSVYGFHAREMDKFYRNNRHSKPFNGPDDRNAFEAELLKLGEYVPKLSSEADRVKAMEYSDSYMSVNDVFRKSFSSPRQFNQFTNLVSEDVLHGLCDGVSSDVLTEQCLQSHEKYREVSLIAQSMVKPGQDRAFTLDQSGLAQFSPQSEEAFKAIEAATKAPSPTEAPQRGPAPSDPGPSM